MLAASLGGMTIKTMGGFGMVMGVAALLIGCGGANNPPVEGSTQDDSQAPSQAKLPPKKTDSAPSQSGQNPSGSTSKPGDSQSNQNGQPGQNGVPGQDGQPGAQGQNGENVCCYNNAKYDCPDAKSCLGGYDLEACQAACKDDDFNCEIACVDKLSSVGPPTNACKPAGKCN